MRWNGLAGTGSGQSDRHSPLVLIPTHAREAAGSYPPSYAVGRRYAHALEAAGAAGVLVPQIESIALLRRIYQSADGILFAGGRDIEPDCYGCDPHPALGETETGRDSLELTLARWALEDGLPILGVCRGMQLLVVASGGRLIQDIGSSHEEALTHDQPLGSPRHLPSHHVTIEEGSGLAGALGVAVLDVNSFHHQAALEISAPFVAVAWAEDGVVEGMERRDGPFAIGVQWHPEEMLTAESRGLFGTFADHAARFAAERVTTRALPG